MNDSVLDLKDKLNALTSVPPDRQKILGLVKGKLPTDEVTMYAGALALPSISIALILTSVLQNFFIISFHRKALKLTMGKKFSLMGTPIGFELQSRPEDMPDVLNDLDIDVSEYPELMLSFANDQRNIRKVREATEALELHVMNEPREGKPLLVLDLDYSESLLAAGILSMKRI